MMRLKRIFVRFIINNFSCCTPFFFVKRFLPRWAGVKTAENVRIAGPIFFSNISIGKNTWIGNQIGDNVDIAPHVVINTGVHIIGSAEHRVGEGVVVIEDVEENTLVVGGPAKQKKKYSSWCDIKLDFHVD